MRPSQSQPSGGEQHAPQGSQQSRPRVFLFVACPQGVYGQFESAVRELGAVDRVEPIAVSTYPSAEYLEAFLDENRHDISCIAIDLKEPKEAIDLIEIAARVAPNALLLATDDGSRAESILPALRAGAKDAIGPPYAMQDVVRRVFSRSGPQAGGETGRLVCFLPAQGGSGASTSALHFAASLAAEIRPESPENRPTSPVLLIDLDFYSDSTAFWLNKRPAYSLIDALEGAAASSLYWRKVTTAWNGIDLLSPPPPDRYVSEELLASLPGVIAAARRTYPWVVVDLPPTLFASTRELLPKADLLYLVCTPDARALYLARRRISDLRGLGISDDALRVTLNRAGAKRAIEAATAEKSIGAAVHFSIDNDYLEICSAYSERRLAAPTSAPGRQFKAMARVALGLAQPGTEKASGWRRLVGFG